MFLDRCEVSLRQHDHLCELDERSRSPGAKVQSLDVVCDRFEGSCHHVVDVDKVADLLAGSPYFERIQFGLSACDQGWEWVIHRLVAAVAAKGPQDVDFDAFCSGVSGQSFAGQFRPSVAEIRGANVVEVDISFAEALLVGLLLQINRVGRRAAVIDEMLRFGSDRPLEHIAVDREVAGNGQRVPFDRGAAADDRGQVDHNVEGGFVLLEEIPAVDAVCDVDAGDLMAFAVECSVEGPANEAGISCNKNFHMSHSARYLSLPVSAFAIDWSMLKTKRSSASRAAPMWCRVAFFAIGNGRRLLCPSVGVW